MYYLCTMIFTTNIKSSSEGVLGFSDLLCTGKYKGRKVLDICVEDIEYLRWMMDNGSTFAFNVEKVIKSTKIKPREYKRKKKK